jgi:very-short-patch-repair endonuclease
LQDFLSKNGIEFSPNRQLLIGKEIDLLIEEKRIGIEFDGLKWHTEWFGKKDRNYHCDKTNRCNEKGYGLIHIFEDEYVNKKEIVLNKLKHLLHLNYNLPKISGRKIQIREIYKYDAQMFLEQYHIQGFSSSTVYLGGFYDNELIAVMAFKHGNVKNPNWELTRFATNFNYIYQGVGSKMFKYFIKTYNPNIIVSFADRRWTPWQDNNLYVKLGFELESINKPDYRYYNEQIDKYKRIHKMAFNKKVLSHKYGFPLTMTETEMAKELGYDRIWDCGLFKYVWKREE